MTFQQAIDGLYAAFAAYPLRETIDGCPCCTSPADNIDLHAAPLRELTTDHLARLCYDAMCLLGDVEDFKHFLPRLFELNATVGFPIPATEILYGKLAYGNFVTWPQAEQGAVRTFAIAHWRAALVDENAEELHADVTADDPEAILTGVMRFGDDLTPYLEVLREFPESVESFRAEYGRRWRNAFLDETTVAAEQQFRDWLEASDSLA